MIQKVTPGPRYGTVEIPASKSVAHRLLICAALYGNGDVLHCDGISRDILATINCLISMGAKTEKNGKSLTVTPVSKCGNPAIHIGEYKGNKKTDCQIPALIIVFISTYQNQ